MTWLLRGPLTGLPSTPEGTAEPPCGVQKCLKGVGRVTGRVGAFRVLSLAAVLAGGGIFVLGTLQQAQATQRSKSPSSSITSG